MRKLFFLAMFIIIMMSCNNRDQSVKELYSYEIYNDKDTTFVIQSHSKVIDHNLLKKGITPKHSYYIAELCGRMVNVQKTDINFIFKIKYEDSSEENRSFTKIILDYPIITQKTLIEYDPVRQIASYHVLWSDGKESQYKAKE